MFQINETIIDEYAAYTGDRNGLHVCDEYARHYLNGKRVCHGTMLTSLALSNLPELCRGVAVDELKVVFEAPVCVGDSVSTSVICDGDLTRCALSQARPEGRDF
jgi:acyl dehydratase